jgi:FG-GAP repeat protein
MGMLETVRPALAIRLFMDSPFLSPLLTTLFLCAAPASAQTVGGSYDTLYQWDGQATVDVFGYALAAAGDIDGDRIDDVIIAAYRADPGGLPRAGTASVYSGADGSLIHQWNGQAAGEHFGYSVSGAGDVNADGFADLIIGAKDASVGGLRHTGSALLYSGRDGSLLFRLDGQTEFEAFGSSVAGAGDVNQDGFSDVLIGAPQADPHGTKDAGSVFLYSGANGKLLYQWHGAEQENYFGRSVAAAGDVNQDGYPDVIVGALWANHVGLAEAGAAYVYSGANGHPLYRWDGDAAYAWFGQSVAGAGDINRDGYDDLIVGAVAYNLGWRGDPGSVYVYSGADGTLMRHWFGQGPDDQFGISVSGAGDFDQDGFDDVLIGANGTDPGGLAAAGSAFVFSGDTGVLLHQWDGTAEYDYLGIAVSAAGDLDRNGYADILVGATGADPGGISEAGSAYLFRFNTILRANISNVSAAAGGILDLNFDFPTSAGLNAYKVLISSSGMGPIHFGIDIPLTLDLMLRKTILGNYPVPTSTLQGTLNATGDGFGQLLIPAGLPAALIGQVYYLAVIAHRPGQLPELSSVAISLTIIP